LDNARILNGRRFDTWNQTNALSWSSEVDPNFDVSRIVKTCKFPLLVYLSLNFWTIEPWTAARHWTERSGWTLR